VTLNDYLLHLLKELGSLTTFRLPNHLFSSFTHSLGLHARISASHTLVLTSGARMQSAAVTLPIASNCDIYKNYPNNHSV